MGTKDNPGTFDCYRNAEPDEPMFTLLARDSLAPQTIRFWADMRAIHMTHGNVLEVVGEMRKIREARDCAAAMEAWHEENR